MALHEKAFWFICFFLGGVLIASITRQLGHPLMFAVLVGTILVLIVCMFARRPMGWLSLALIAGSLYLFYFNQLQAQRFTVPLQTQIEITAMALRVSRGDQSQSVDVSLEPPYQGKVRLYLREYPTVRYGDELKVVGSLQPIPGDRAGYFLKENIRATLSFPKSFEITAHDKGSTIKTRLYAIRDWVEASFRKNLAPEPATLMTGLILGKSGGFSKEFTEKLKLSGTTHLVALSGQNITIIINALAVLLGSFFSRRFTVYLSILAIIGFVVMTGAEASVVRAAIMATIVVIAERASRIHSARSAIAVAAFVMVCVNPSVLAFDVGFQLSFLALIGIVYLDPILRRIFRVSESPGLLCWRKNMWMSISAQLAVLPILLLNFGFVSPVGVISSMLLVSFVPYTMFAGVLIVVLSSISSLLAILAVIPAQLLLGYELFIINICARLSSWLGFS